MALGENGLVWVSGITFSRDLPVTARAAQREFAGGTDAFLMQIDPRLSGPDALIYSTYLGGSGFEFIYDMKVSGTRAVVGGYSMQGQLPTTSNAIRREPSSPFAEGMVAVIDTANTGVEGLEYLTYFGGAFTDVVNSVGFDALDTNSLIFVGYTNSANLPTTDGSLRGNAAPAPNAFIGKIVR